MKITMLILFLACVGCGEGDNVFAPSVTANQNQGSDQQNDKSDCTGNQSSGCQSQE